MKRKVHRVALEYLPSPNAPSATWVRAICLRTHRAAEASVVLANGETAHWPPPGLVTDSPSDPVERAIFYVRKYGGCDAEHVL